MTNRPTASANLILPRGVTDLVTQVPCRERHPGLQLDKLSRPPEKQEHQRKAIEGVCKAVGDQKLLAELRHRRDAALTQASARCFRATSVGPLTLHLTRASGLENAGIHLHPVYGFVCLPGSGLKGTARSYAETVWLPDQLDPVAAWNDIRTVFGWAPKSESAKSWKPAGVEDADGSSAGAVVFHDAWPVEWPRLEPDIVNSHHAQYYADTDDPGDWDEPNMAFFLSVQSGTTFDFAVSVRSRIDDGLLTRACTWLQAALAHEGAGAKTNSGYGRFRLAEGCSVPAVPVSARRVSTHTLSLVTPAFLAGAMQKREDCNLRPATLRGLLRWWWRTIHAAHLDRTNLRLLETALWGDAQIGGALALSVQSQVSVDPQLFDKKKIVDNRCHGERGIEYLAYGMDEKRRREERQQRWYVTCASWELTLTARRAGVNGSSIDACDVLRQGEAALWLLCRYGGVGSKARKGFGSFADVEITGVKSVEDCKKIAADLRGDAGLHGPRGAVVSSGVDRMLPPLEVSTPWRDPWFALSQLGGAIQGFARQNSHQSRKKALGLPRQIHGPLRRPLDHQEPRSHRPPSRLSVKRGSRFAAPVHYHYARRNDGTLTLRMTAFPSPDLPDIHTSRAVLGEVEVHVQAEIERRKRRYADRGTRPFAKESEPSGSAGSGSEVRGEVPSAGEVVVATLLEERTRKGGWKAEHEPSGLQGPIQNTGDVPDGAKAGDRVNLKVRYATLQAIAFGWPLSRDGADTPRPKQSARRGGSAGGDRRKRRRSRQ